LRELPPHEPRHQVRCYTGLPRRCYTGLPHRPIVATTRARQPPVLPSDRAGPEYTGADACKPQVAVTDGGAVVVTTNEAHGVPPELARIDPGSGAWARLTSFNHEIVDGVEFPDARTVRWTSTDGLEIEGRLLTPPGATGPRRSPPFAWTMVRPGGLVVAARSVARGTAPILRSAAFRGQTRGARR
jgi:hypothetical protein